MSKEIEAGTPTPPSPSVEELEEQLTASPDNLELRLNLTEALLNRYIFGDSDHLPEDETDIARLRELLGTLPEDDTLSARAYLDYHDNKEQAFIESSLKWLSSISHGVDPPFTCDELYFTIIMPFAFGRVPTGLWAKWADQLEQAWPNSSAAFTVRGIAQLESNNFGEAIDSFVLALAKDSTYWFAAWNCAGSYELQKNWRGALSYYLKALNVDAARKEPAIHFDIAWCLGQLKTYHEEEKHYRLCLELDPDFLNARNNLGVSLLKQKKYEDALKVFDEAIERGNDGRRPLQNRARMLARLGRYSDSIEAWRHAGPRAKPPKWIEREIKRVENLAERAKLGQVINEDDVLPVSSDDSEDSLAEAREVPPARGVPEPRVRPTPVRTEQMLEEMLEQRIQSGREVFGRKLRMYNSPDDSYGRQYSIPGVGRIDLLVEDIETGDLIVIELKRDESHEEVVGQISLYMSWIRENRAAKERKVCGIICVNRASDKLLLAARNVAGVEVLGYDLAFSKL